MKRHVFQTITAVLLAVMLLTSCAKLPPEGVSSDYKAVPPTPPAIQSQPAAEAGAEEAYWLLFEKLWAEDDGLNDGIQYLSLDLSQVKLKDTAPLTKQVQDFCDEKGFELLSLPFEELKAQGYIKDLTFEKGIIISFEDQSLTETTLVTKAQKWRSGDGAIGAAYTVEKKSDGWSVTGAEGAWIS